MYRLYKQRKIRIMKKIFDMVKSNPLFDGIAFSDFASMFNCLSFKTVRYERGSIILMSGDTVDFVGIVLFGSVQIIYEDTDGHNVILTELSVSEMFGEVFACAGITQSPVTIQASEDSEILYIDYKRIIHSCTSACPFHTRLIANMLKLIADKNLLLSQKIEILSKRTTREKLISYFNLQRGVTKKFSISFNREELASCLCVDRSAMSNELCKMRDEGLIRFHRNTFEILY